MADNDPDAPTESISAAKNGTSDGTVSGLAGALAPVRDRDLLACAAAIVLILLFRLLHSIWLHPLRIGWDPALHLQAAQLILEGKVPYVDMFDVNPPLVWYLDMIPAFFSNLLNFPVTQAFSLFLVGIIFYSAVACGALLFIKGRRGDAPLFIPFLIGLLLFNFFLRWDYGQREEIFVLLYMPFLILRCLRWSGRGVDSRVWSSAIGVIASIGICLKHYFLIPAFLVEVFFLIEKRKWRPLLTAETIACFLTALAYLGHFLLVPHAMRDSYFKFIIPAFNLGYNFWDTSLGAMYSPPEKRDVFFLMAAACAIAVALRKRSSLMLPLVVFVLGANVVYLMQFKGWPYHDQPVYAGAFILAVMQVGYLILLLLQRLRRYVAIPRRVALAALVVAVFGVALQDGTKDALAVQADRQFDMSRIGYRGLAPRSDIEGQYADLVIDTCRLGDKVVFIWNGVAPGYPMLTQLRCVPGSRHLHSVILSVLSYIKDSRPQTEENVKLWKNTDRIVKEYGEDIVKNRPRLVFIQKVPDYFDKPYNFVATYLKDYIELPGDWGLCRVFKLNEGQ